ncbi:MAG: murein biosynthesis integral membrane protein MurJ [Rhizobiales bacterium 12-68-15]|nr:MAG: murein biosynthesis integral membrane protein MurJ [Rhizobiales bacterium 12-68-15]
MFRSILSVGGLTLLSRLAGFIRDVVMAAVLGAGPVADAFLVAFRLPNHFRAIFAEGAFNAAFVPTYARLKEQGGTGAAKGFADEILTAMAGVHLVLLALALALTPQFVGLLAPGLGEDSERFALAVTLTRITFPYLALVSVATLLSGALNANDRFAMAAASPILLNVCMIGTLSAAALFPTAGHAAAWGVLLSGIGQVLVLMWDAERSGIGVRFARPRLDPGTKRFLKALGPAIIGSAGVQIALFADTIIATFLPTGALSALYYADRINQLPIGVVGGDAAEAAATLQAYAIGLIAIVVMRAFVAPFHARSDTTTPMIASLTAISVNVALKFALMGGLAQVGLALATAIGGWINLTLLIIFARRRGLPVGDSLLGGRLARIGASAGVLALVLWFGPQLAFRLTDGMTYGRDELVLLLVVMAGGVAYGAAILLLLGKSILAPLRRRRGKAADSSGK